MPSTALLPGLVVPVGVLLLDWPIAVVLGVLVVGKFLYDLRRLQVARDPDARGLFYRLYGSAETEPEPVPVEVPPGDPVVRDRSPWGAALLDALGVTWRLDGASDLASG